MLKQKKEIEKQRDEIRLINQDIRSSIEYANRIQTAVLQPVNELNELFADSFIFNIIPKPENVTISASNNNITISWNEVENADSYNIYSSSDSNEPLENWVLEESGIQDTLWIDVSGETKFYFVKTIMSSY